MGAGPYSLRNPFTHTPLAAIASAGVRWVERLFGIPLLNSVYSEAVDSSAHFADAALQALRTTYALSEAQLAKIPRSGPLIVVANHPYGAVDGLVLNSVLRRARGDVKLFGSVLLRKMPAYRDDFFLVDNFGGPDAPARNIAATKAAMRWLRNGHCLGVFPAGEVSHRTWRHPQVADPAWNAMPARLAQATGATVLPIYFDGHNSTTFQLAGLIHPRLRTVLLAREVERCRNRRLRFVVGNPISSRRIRDFGTPDELTGYLRLRTYILRHRLRRPEELTPPVAGCAQHQSLSAPESPGEMAREVAALPPARRLAELDEFAVFYAGASEIPAVLREIGRLRELTFRGVGEGTGKPTDLDRFDADYLHLFMWSTARQKVIGAYRMGLTDEITARSGIGGLYSSTLFRIRRELLDQIGPAVELGRSFVRPEHQREYAPLLLLWRGIARFVAAHPRYKVLLGPVSISNDYQSLTKHLLMRFLTENAPAPDLAALVTPRNAPRRGHFRALERDLSRVTVRNVDDVDELVGEIEADRASMPVLLRQYLRLNARLLAFNVDPDFNDVLDGLMLADLTGVDPAILKRYMGRDAADGFLRHWQSPTPPIACAREIETARTTVANQPEVTF